MLRLEIQKSYFTHSNLVKSTIAFSNLKNTRWTQWIRSETSSEVGLSLSQRKASTNSRSSTNPALKVKFLKYNISRRTIGWKFKHINYLDITKLNRCNISQFLKFKETQTKKISATISSQNSIDRIAIRSEEARLRTVRKIVYRKGTSFQANSSQTAAQNCRRSAFLVLKDPRATLTPNGVEKRIQASKISKYSFMKN